MKTTPVQPFIRFQAPRFLSTSSEGDKTPLPEAVRAEIEALSAKHKIPKEELEAAYWDVKDRENMAKADDDAILAQALREKAPRQRRYTTAAIGEEGGFMKIIKD